MIVGSTYLCCTRTWVAQLLHPILKTGCNEKLWHLAAKYAVWQQVLVVMLGVSSVRQ